MKFYDFVPYSPIYRPPLFGKARPHDYDPSLPRLSFPPPVEIPLPAPISMPRVCVHSLHSSTDPSYQATYHSRKVRSRHFTRVSFVPPSISSKPLSQQNRPLRINCINCKNPAIGARPYLPEQPQSLHNYHRAPDRPEKTSDPHPRGEILNPES